MPMSTARDGHTCLVHPGVEALGYAKRIIPFSDAMSMILIALPSSSWSVISGNLSPSPRPFLGFLAGVVFSTDTSFTDFAIARFLGAEAGFAVVVDGCETTRVERRVGSVGSFFFAGIVSICFVAV
jgi:hypothetical protein